MPGQPNILFVTTDQQRYDSCGPQAPAFMRMPHFDLLCREGITFSRGYSDCPICVPARLSMLTGKHAYTHGMLGNGESRKVVDREGTLPTCLRELGYQTAAIGKMHWGPERTRHGFEEMILPADYYLEMSRSGQPLQPMRHGLGQNELYPTLATVPESQTLTNWIAEQCVRYIHDRRDPTRPFFLWCSFSKPHPPLDPPEPYYSMYRGCAIPEPVYGEWSTPEKCPPEIERQRQNWSADLLTPEVLREARAAYLGLITQIDYNLGRVLSALQDLNLLAETLIVYTSDHGEFLGDHHCGSKVQFHEPAAHVPFVVRPPRSWANRLHGTTVKTPVSHCDILPTLVRAAGGEPPADVDGLDLVALARGELKNPRCYVVGQCGWHGGAQGGWTGITDGELKYIWFPEGGYEHFFNLDADPYELRNLADRPEYAERKAELRAALIENHARRNSALVADGQLVKREIQNDSVRDRRAANWPGLHTERFNVDVRH